MLLGKRLNIKLILKNFSFWKIEDNITSAFSDTALNLSLAYFWSFLRFNGFWLISRKIERKGIHPLAFVIILAFSEKFFLFLYKLKISIIWQFRYKLPFKMTTWKESFFDFKISEAHRLKYKFWFKLIGLEERKETRTGYHHYLLSFVQSDISAKVFLTLAKFKVCTNESI